MWALITVLASDGPSWETVWCIGSIRHFHQSDTSATTPATPGLGGMVCSAAVTRKCLCCLRLRQLWLNHCTRTAQSTCATSLASASSIQFNRSGRVMAMIVALLWTLLHTLSVTRSCRFRLFYFDAQNLSSWCGMGVYLFMPIMKMPNVAPVRLMCSSSRRDISRYE